MRNSTSLSFSLESYEPLSTYSEQVRQEFEDHLAAALTAEAQDVVPLLKRGARGGKRLRPVLCRLVSDALDGDAHLAFECGVALELIHSGALIHDDWIDGDVFRRDAPALWQELGPRTAVLVADLLIETGSIHGAITEATSRSLAKAARNLSEGAIADFTDHANYTEAVYLKRIKRKTAALYATSAELGALVSPRIDLGQLLYRYGECVGIMYQLADDFVDLLKSLLTGTPIGDLSLGIPTLPLTRLARLPGYQPWVQAFLADKDAAPLIANGQPEDAHHVYEELLEPWRERARGYLQELPGSPYRDLLELVPSAFATELLQADIN
jgi:geranylgeranyl pyrophosphate synthase